MKNILLHLFFLLIILTPTMAQERSSFYATMDSNDAERLQLELPQEIEIIATRKDQSAVFISAYAANELQENLIEHGPGFVFRASKEKAIKALENDLLGQSNKTILYTITEDVMVNEALDMVEEINIENVILSLEGYGTRYHTKTSATQAVMDLRDTWENMAIASGRSDISVRIFYHANTNMPSVILTIEGAESPDDFIIVGGHMDSSNYSNQNDAPGADDNGSGVASIVEMSRVLIDMDFIPKKTIEFMAFAAEEIGLVGSDEIAEEYSNNSVNVEAFVQFDMTNYKGSTNDVYISADNYTSPSLNGFLYDLMDHYNNSGTHQFSYGTTSCNYGCSDHYSWAQYGYNASFPFESIFGQHNPYIHSSQDTYSVTGNSEHAAKFVKLGLEFIIEAAKSHTLSTNDQLQDNFKMLIKDRQLVYQLNDMNDSIHQLDIFDITGKRILVVEDLNRSGSIPIENIMQGFYVAVFDFVENGSLTNKFILN
jgi:leucyl aminopeptidase